MDDGSCTGIGATVWVVVAVGISAVLNVTLLTAMLVDIGRHLACWISDHRLELLQWISLQAQGAPNNPHTVDSLQVDSWEKSSYPPTHLWVHSCWNFSTKSCIFKDDGFKYLQISKSMVLMTCLGHSSRATELHEHVMVNTFVIFTQLATRSYHENTSTFTSRCLHFSTCGFRNVRINGYEFPKPQTGEKYM